LQSYPRWHAGGHHDRVNAATDKLGSHPRD
jgi:hypothetical protein